ncbi:MAG: hypothetical protein L0323_19275 [Planctomycetes bacterium]|nr:hypothetical protein [Planctomycetota bacterium]
MRGKPLFLFAPGAGLLGLLLLGSTGTRGVPDDEGTARALSIPVEDVRALRASRGLTDADFRAMPPEVLERVRRKLHLPKPDSPEEWAAWRLSFWRDENGAIPENALLAAREQFEALAALETAGGLSAGAWTALGPGNIGGRVRSILPHPTDPDTLFAGSVSGGIWKTTDGGSSWSAVDDFMGNLAVTSLILVPSNPSVMYAATGEGFFNSDAIQGAGIFQSLDGGTTWTQLPSTANPNFYWVNRLALSPDESSLLAATGSGIWRSGNGGTFWSAAYTGANRRSLDVDFHPTDSSLAVAHIIDWDAANSTFFTSGLSSTSGGNTWTEASGLHVNSNLARVELAYHRGWTGAGNGCVYALQATGGGTLKRSLDGGATYSVVSTVNQGSGGWYYNALWIDPTDLDASTADDVVIFGGLDLYRSANGGASFTKISQWYSWPSSAHADHHAIVEAPGFDGAGNRAVYFGNDGGIWKTDDVYAIAPLSGWLNLNNALAITQGYGGSRSPVSGAVILGTQDNGTLRYTPAGGPNAWTTMFGGDGGFCASDQADPDVHYGEYVRAQVHRSSNGGTSATYIDGKHWNGSTYVWKPLPYKIPDAESGAANFIAPILLDPNDDDRLFVGGASLWQTNDAKAALTSTTGPAWAGIKAPVASSSRISAIAVAQGQPDVIWVGHNNGEVYSTSNGTAASPTWTQRDTASPGLPDRKVSRITIDPANSSRVFVTLGGFASDNLWQTTNGGTSWTAASGMPAVPLRDVEINPAHPDWLYAGSELGVLISEDDGISWSVSLEGPSLVSVDELFWSSGHLYAVTHGRGVFRQTPFPAAVSATGAGCQEGISPPLPAAPTLAATTPTLGQTWLLTLSSAPGPSTAFLLASAPPPFPTPITPACSAYLDVLTAVGLATFPTSGGGLGVLPIPLPDSPAVGGAALAFQAAVPGPGGGFAFSNGLVATFGY